MHTIHLISHTHWDREWYRSFQQFRLRLVHLVDGLLDILDQDPEFKHFMLDGQTIVLDDYLHIRPEAESKLCEYIQNGRLLIGPWHILPDMFLVSGEAHIRNLLAGERECRRFGPRMMIGYMPDSFGHIGQMPQILHGFSIDNACLWRGLDDQPAEFWWQAPDGSRVLMLYLRDSYSNGASLLANDPAQFTGQIKAAAESIKPHSAVSHLLIMYGTDHMEPSPHTSTAIQAANQAAEGVAPDCLVHSTLPTYLESVQRDIAILSPNLPTLQGELRSSKRSHLLPGVLSTRMWIKQRNHACENLLEKWAEPFSTFASLLGANNGNESSLRRPRTILRQAWQILMECHPHDSICGCSIDQVHDEMRPRFDQVEQIGEEITRQSLEAIAAKIDTSSQVAGSIGAVVVFNPSSHVRTDIVSAEISLPPGVSGFELVDENGKVLPHQSVSGRTADLINVRVRQDDLGGMLAMVNNGRAGNLSIQALEFKRSGSEAKVEVVFADNAEPRIDVWESGLESFKQVLSDQGIETIHIHARLPDSASISFVAPEVPGLGWKSFFVRPRETAAEEIKISPVMRMLFPLAKLPAAQGVLAWLSRSKVKPPYRISNEFFDVQLDEKNGTLSLTEHETGRTTHGLNRFVDSGDCGDEYNFSPPPADCLQSETRLREVTIQSGPVQSSMTASLTLLVPAGLSSDRKSRSKEMVELPITTTITLIKGVKRVEIHTRVDNCAKDHRLRVHFPIPLANVDTAGYDGHFEVVTRPIGLPEHDDTWIEKPRPEAPQRAFTALSEAGMTWTIANRGLPEVEVMKSSNAEGTQVAITLLRCVGWLSRDDFTTRKGHAGPFLETPGAQMQGTWEFDYSILTDSDPATSRRSAWDFEVPLRAVATGTNPGSLERCRSMVEVSDPSFVITAVKQAEDDDGWVLRGCNYSEKETEVKLAPACKVSLAHRANLAEVETSLLKNDAAGRQALKVRPHEIATVKFK